VDMQPPTRRVAGAGDLSEGAEGRMQVTAQTADGAIQFVLQLSAASAASTAARAAATPASVS